VSVALAAVERASESRDLEAALRSMRFAQRSWAEEPIGIRTGIIQRFRHAVAANAKNLAGVVQNVRVHSSVAEILSSEVLPLLDACHFAEERAAELLRIVKPKRKDRPFWLAGTGVELRREPFGTVLIIAPGNYPLVLSGVQTIQALVAGNAILMKPAPGASLVTHRFRDLLIEAGLNAPLFQVIDEDPEWAHRAIELGVDKIILTGSELAGREVLRKASETITPVTCELSGCDAMIVLPGADLDLAARALRFALRLNAAQTCMRPHRVFVHSQIAHAFKCRVIEATRDLRIPLAARAISKLIDLVKRATQRGAIQITGTVFEDDSASPHVLENGDFTSELWQSDLFAPVLVFSSFDSERDLLENVEACRYGLGACIFGTDEQAQRLAARMNTGFVLINDVIVPTADPRFPFSGRKRSGFGVTRGAEGLLEFTRLKAVSIRRSGYRHYEDEHATDEDLFAGTIAAVHGRGLLKRTRGAAAAFRAVRIRMQSREKVSS